MPTPNLPEWEKETTAFWKKNQIFEKSIANRPADNPYVFYDGPPFATGLPHYGHLLASTIKDVVPRYFTMKGYQVTRRWGWDCHGLPIENIVENQLKISGKKQIEEIGIEAFNQTCKDNVMTYATEWGKMVDRIGRWVDFEGSYKTMDSTYMESVWWAVKRIWDSELLYEGLKVLMYCTRCETPVSKFEVAMDNSYQDVTEESVYVKFKVTSSPNDLPENTFVLAWTTTPWTLPGNMALAVGEDINYVLVKVEDEHYVLAQDRLNLFEQQEYQVLNTFKGKELVGATYQPLFDIPAVTDTGKKAYYVTTADFVTAEDGTGVVHTAVIYGEDDFNLGVQIDLPMVPLLNSRGEFLPIAPELVRGVQFKESERAIKNDLEQRGLMFARTQFTHSYPFCWRCESPLIYNAIPAWFINIQKIKPRLLELAQKMNWFPDHLKEGRFKYTVENAPDWNISRNRYFATPLPIWRCDSEDCEQKVCVGSLAELQEKATNYDEVYDSRDVKQIDFHRPNIDRVLLSCEKCGGSMHRVIEVIDCWVEAGSMPFAEHHYPFENKELFEKRYPAQFVVEYIAQTRTWFFFMLVMSTLMFDDIAVENTLVTGTILNEKGEKMSKSKRNFPDPWEIVDKYGADSLRWYLSSSAVMSGEDLFFKEREVDETYKKVMLLSWNVVAFWKLHADTPRGEICGTGHVLDTWIMALLNQTGDDVTRYMDRYDLPRATRTIREFINELSTWYVRRSRDRFKADDEDAQAAHATLYHVVMELTKLLAPFAPHLAERMYQELGGQQESVHLCDWPGYDPSQTNASAIAQMDVVRKLVEMGLALRAQIKQRVRQPLQLFVYEGTNKLDEAYEQIIADELNVKQVAHGAAADAQEPATKTAGTLTVTLDAALNDALRQEGAARECMRAINGLRKQAGLTITDRAQVGVHTEDAWLRDALQKHQSTIEAAGRCDLRWESVESDQSIEVSVADTKATITLTKI